MNLNQESSGLDDATTDVLIVGGGPVGTYLGCVLSQMGIACEILEQRTERFNHTRSIGIHPPALRSLDDISVAQQVVERATIIREGIVLNGTKRLGSLSLTCGPPPYPFVLSLPQHKTEAILESRFCDLAPGSLRRGHRVHSIKQLDDRVLVETEFDGAMVRHQARFVVGCDGPKSVVREAVEISFEGSSYSDSYIMGDFADTTAFGDDATVFLCPEGVIESFPLPGGVRRWVARVDKLIVDPTAEQLRDLVSSRTGCDVETGSCSMMSSFRPEHYLASAMRQERVFLAGDAAHIISPIGGQGMNLGWLDARAAARAIAAALRRDDDADELMVAYSSTRRKAAQDARRRAEFNMWMGRPTGIHALKIAAARVVISPPFRGFFVRRFTMQGL